jgi:hypothetical protein
VDVGATYAAFSQLFIGATKLGGKVVGEHLFNKYLSGYTLQESLSHHRLFRFIKKLAPFSQKLYQ